MSKLKSNLALCNNESNESESCSDSGNDSNEFIKKNNIKIESNISLNEENIIQKKLRSMDIRMNNLIYNLDNEVKWNDIIRGNPSCLNKYRYLIPDIRKIHDYKNVREKKIKKHKNSSILNTPDNTVYGVNESIFKNIDLNKNITSKDIFYTLLSFYKNQIRELLNESELLISRWIRFCNNPKLNEMESVQEIFENAHSIIYNNLRDAIKRYSNLKLFATELKIKLKNKMNIKAKSKEEAQKEEEKIKNDFYSKADFKLGFDVTDFLVYLHHYLGKIYLEKPLQWYFTCQKLLVKSEMFDLLRNYEIIKNKKNIQLLPDSLQFLDKVNMEIPLKLCSYEIYFQKYSSLLRHFKIDSSIFAEDGRRLAYEIDFCFNELFKDNLIDIQIYADDNKKEENNKKENNQDFKETKNYSKFYINMPTYIRDADWIDEVQINPEFSDEYYSYNEWLLKEKEFDYELKLNYELIKVNDVKRCILKLQELTKLRFEEFSKDTDFNIVDKKTPLNNSEIKPQFEVKRNSSENYKNAEDGHNFSLNIQNKEEDNNTDIFQNKLNILKNLEKNSSNKTANLSNAIAEYELYEYFQLRHLRMREFRYNLLNQFNYLRSIEKRITCDIKELNKKRDNDLCDDQETQRKFCFSDFEEKLKFKKKNISKLNNSHKSWHYRYDNSKLYGDVIKLIDNTGKEFIYDIAYDDLVKREKELLKIGTCYLNSRTNNQLIEYSGEMKEIGYDIFKDQDIKNSSYLNPKYDRAEILYELYDYETRFQNTKINLINCYLEVYENATSNKDILRLAQIITNYINIKPTIQYEDEYFSHSYICEINSLENHLNLVKDILKYTLERTKSFYSYISLNVVKTHNNNASEGKDVTSMGMPRFNYLNNKYYPINMHYPEISLHITDIYPNLGDISNLLYIQENLKKEFIEYYKTVFPNKTLDPIYIECILWDTSYKKWIDLVNSNFEDDNIKKNVEKLFNDRQLEDIQIPDIILENQYIDFIEKQKGNNKSKNEKYYMESNYKKSNEDYESSMNNLFLNSEFNYNSRDILLNFLKMISSRNKLLYSYIETEYCREIYNKQIYYMKVSVDDENYEKVKMFNITNNSETNNNNNVNDTNNNDDIKPEMVELDPQTVFKNDIAHEREEYRGVIEDTDFYIVPHQDFKPLLYNELIDEDEEFDLPSYNNIIKYIDADELTKILQALKLQQIEQINYNSSINIHKYCMIEIYPILIKEYLRYTPKEVILNKKVIIQKSNDIKQKRSISYNINYSNLVFTTTTEKTLLKLIINSEWKKINMKINDSLKNFEGNLKEQNQYKLLIERKEKNKLIEWFSSNYLEITKEIYYKVAYIEKISKLKNRVLEYPYGKMLFQISKYKNFNEYFKEISDDEVVHDNNSESGNIISNNKLNKNNVINNEDQYNSNDDLNDSSFIIQPLKICDNSNDESICYLWYISSPIEIIMDNKIKQYDISPFLENFDYNKNLFSQKKNFKRALKLNGYLKDIFELTSNYGWFLQRNIIYKITNDIIKQADYVLTNFTCIKEKLGNINEIDNYNSVKSILYYEWKKYNLLMKAFKSLSIDVLYFNGLLDQVNSIIPYCNLNLQPYKEDKYKINIWQNSYPLYKKEIHSISIHMYYKLSLNDKKLCDLKISKMEEVMNKKFSNDKRFKKDENYLIKINEIEYLEQLLNLTGIRLEYYRMRMKNVIKIDFEKSKVFFKFYKNDILFNSIRLFYKNDSNQREYSEIMFDTTMELKGSETSYAVQILFEQYQVSLMKDDLYYYYTLNLYNHANSLMAKINNLNKITSNPFNYQKESVLFSNNKNSDLNVYMTQEEFDYKYYILNTFINNIYQSDKKVKKKKQSRIKNHKAHIDFNESILSDSESLFKEQSAINSSNKYKKNDDITNIDDIKFSNINEKESNEFNIKDHLKNSTIEISKKDLFRSINNLAINMFEWQQERDITFNKFFCSLQTKMNDNFHEYEQQIRNMKFEKKQILDEFNCEVLLESANTNDAVVLKLKKLSQMIEEQKEIYKEERKKIKEKITNEYKELIQELVDKFIAVKQQFNDYRILTKQETLKIMNESKAENLRSVINSEMMSDSLIEFSKKTLSHDEIINNYKDEINDLKYTNMKMRSFFILLINKIKMQCKLEKRNLKASFKKKETTLWKNYSDFKLRDDMLNDELRKSRKELIFTNIENEKLRNKVKELNKLIDDYKVQLSIPSDRKKVINLKKRINYYKNLNIIQLINELNQKTNLALKLSEKLKKYTNEEEVFESNFSNDLYHSIQELMNDENEAIKILNMKNENDSGDNEIEENEKINNDKVDKIDNNISFKNKENQNKKPLKHETAKAKIYKALYNNVKPKHSRPLMSYRNNPLSVNEDKIHKDIEKMKRNEYDYSSHSIDDTMSIISYDNSMTKDNYLEIINSLIKENCLLKKKITDQNTNFKNIKNEIVNVNDELYNIQKSKFLINCINQQEYSSTDKKNKNILKEERFNNITKYPPVKSISSISHKKERNDRFDNKIELDMRNKNNNKDKTILKTSKSTLNKKLSGNQIISDSINSFSNSFDINNKCINEYKNSNNYDSYNKNYKNENEHNYKKVNDTNQDNNNNINIITCTNTNNENPEIQKSIEFIKRVYGFHSNNKSRLPPSIRKMYNSLYNNNDNNELFINSNNQSNKKQS